MALNFPSSPTNGQQFGGYTYDSSVGAWKKNPDVASGLPAGTVLAWATDTAPANWLICDGSAVSRTTYASLFAVLGVTYGVGDGSTTFNIPDYRGRVLVGRDSGQTEFDVTGEAGGAKTHTHPLSDNGQAQVNMSANASPSALMRRVTTATYTSTHNVTSAGGTSSATSSSGAALAGATDSASSLPPYRVANYIIKTSAGITSGDSELAVRVGDLESYTGVNRPSFQAHGNTTASKSGAVSTSILVLAVEDFDQANNFDVATGRFTAPVAGLYEFSVMAAQSTATGGPEIAFYKNGSILYDNVAIGYSLAYMNFGGTVRCILAAGDIVDFRWRNNNNTSVTLDLARCYVSGHLIDHS